MGVKQVSIVRSRTHGRIPAAYLSLQPTNGSSVVVVLVQLTIGPKHAHFFFFTAGSRSGENIELECAPSGVKVKAHGAGYLQTI